MSFKPSPFTQLFLSVFLVAAWFPGSVGAQNIFLSSPGVQVYKSNSLGMKLEALKTEAPELRLLDDQSWDQALKIISEQKDRLRKRYNLLDSKQWLALEFLGFSQMPYTTVDILEADATTGLILRQNSEKPREKYRLTLQVLLGPEEAAEGIKIYKTLGFSRGKILEETWQDGRLESQIWHRADYAIEKEVDFDAEGPLEVRIKRYQDNNLLDTRIYSPWALKLTQRFSYTRQGMIREVYLDYPDQADQRSFFKESASGYADQWTLGDGREKEKVFDSYNRLKEERFWLGGHLEEERIYEYQNAEKVLLLSLSVEKPLQGVNILELYDDQGRLYQREEKKAGLLSLRESFLYDPEGNLMYHSENTGKRSREWTWDYVAGVLTREVLREDSKLQRISYYEGDEQQDEIYLDGELVLKVYYRDKQRIRQEEYRSGLLVNSRN